MIILRKLLKKMELSLGELNQVKLSNEEVLYFDSMNEAARHLEVNVGSVSNCLNPKQTAKTVKGYVVELV